MIIVIIRKYICKYKDKVYMNIERVRAFYFQKNYSIKVNLIDGFCSIYV